MDPNSFLNADSSNLPLLEEMYRLYQENPQAVDSSWYPLFSSIDGTEPHSPTQDGYPQFDANAPADIRVYHLIQAYRTYGHLLADLNPLQSSSGEEPWQLRMELLGFNSEELTEPFPTCGLLSEARAPLSDIIDTLKEIYCGKIGVEYMGLQNPQMEEWLQQHIEPNRFKIDLTMDQKQLILQHLNKSELFESFLHTKYVGQKRFSLEGGETLIPILAAILEKGASLHLEEFVLGMAHRGRLNVLSNILEKSYADIFTEFEEGYVPVSFEGSGDVKYHKGFSSEVKLASGNAVKVVLASNPSHLESVNPVVEGMTRAKQVLYGHPNARQRVVPILIHGDASLPGQGVVYETMQLYQLHGYATGGTIHIVINNQIGFTTLPRDGRSTHYCTDIARTFCTPVFHVNAEDPEACVYATMLAIELRQKFYCDVFIDLICYRKYGHNEGDEPAFTQPLEYQIIRKKKPIRELYRDTLIHHGVMEKKMAESLEQEFKTALQKAQEQIQVPHSEKKAPLPSYEPKGSEELFTPVETGVPLERIGQIAERITTIPEGLTAHKKLQNLLKDRLAMAKGKKAIDWGMGEILAYGALLWEGIDVRISGQDCCRGTFSHRHAIIMDQVVDRAYFPLKHLKREQGRFDVLNSPLSEMAILGFEFGYSTAHPLALVVWEAQFGDFCNGAQVIIDQYLATSEQKWGQRNRLVLFLPHGYEGQGPEHSSGRMERFLSLCGSKNMVVAVPSTPAQLFHLLRRQVLGSLHKPLIVFTPKGLLRHPECINDVEALTKGCFEEIVADPEEVKNPRRIAFCCGRIYYELLEERRKRGVEDLVLIRTDQLYPLHKDRISELLRDYPNITECFWVQSEPRNMGAWDFIHPYLKKLLPEGVPLKYVGRARSASPAAGSLALHKREHAEIMGALFEMKERQ